MGWRKLTRLNPWYVRTCSLQQRTGAQIFQAVYGQIPKSQALEGREVSWRAIATLLESPYPIPSELPQPSIARYSICAGPPRCEHGNPKLWTPATGEILSTLQQRLATSTSEPALLTETGQPLAQPIEPFAGGWLGWLGYDLAWEIESLPAKNTDPLPFPVAFWYEPETFIVLDHHDQVLWLAATKLHQLDEIEHAIAHAPPLVPTVPLTFTDHLTFVSSQADYENAVQKAKAHIEAGDIFQTNLSLRFSTQTQADSWAIYQRLHAINPSPFASYWRSPWGTVISCSPERLVSLQGNQVETRPIAGTRPRGSTPQQDKTLAEELVSNPKERAEHIMLVDLERNDLGRVCHWGSVKVDELMTVEPYSHVMHLVSNVQGTLAREQTAIDLIRATFPGGTITGCPKVRCMEIIEDLEPIRRSLFYGSCGYLDYRGHLDLNILIRTLLYVEDDEIGVNTVWGQVGAGIVADSQPTQEWRESLQKAKAQLLAIGTPLKL